MTADTAYRYLETFVGAVCLTNGAALRTGDDVPNRTVEVIDVDRLANTMTVEVISTRVGGVQRGKDVNTYVVDLDHVVYIRELTEHKHKE